MNPLIGICGAAVTAAVCGMVLKRLRPETAAALSAVALVILFLQTAGRYADAAAAVKELAERSGFGSYGTVMLKALGVGVTVKVAADLCRDCGEEGIAGGVELAGKLEILLLCLPLISELLTCSAELMS